MAKIMSFSFPMLLIILVIHASGEIIRHEDAPVCLGVSCKNGGTLDNETCVCFCETAFSGLFCEIKLLTSSWPTGMYGLPMSVYGCPETEAYGWKSGYINMTISDGMSYSYQRSTGYFVKKHSHLLGPYDGSHSLQMNFCVKMINNGSDASWPKDNYCIYRVNNSCADGFLEGSIKMTGYDISQYDMRGWLPDHTLIKGNDSTLTVLELFYCCKNDSNSGNREFGFAKDYPFYVIKHERKCPRISGTSRTEYFYYATGNQSWTLVAPHPDIAPRAEENNSTSMRMAYCYYSPYEYKKWKGQPQIGTGKDLRLLQKRKPAYSSRPYSDEFSARYAMDGSSSMYLWTEAEDKWLLIDMQSFYNVISVQAYFYIGSSLYVMVSKRRWDFLSDGAYSCTLRKPRCSNRCTLTFYCRRSITTQYVIVRETKAYVLGIYEMDIKVEGDTCGKHFGITSGAILDLQLSYSSQTLTRSPNDGICMSSSDAEPYVQVDLIVPMPVQGVIIQGWKDTGGFKSIRSFSVSYGVNVSNLITYEDPTGNQMFVLDEKATVEFQQEVFFASPILATFIRINVHEYGTEPCLKLELIGCPKHVSRDVACQSNSSDIGWGQIHGQMFRPQFAKDTRVTGTNLEACKDRCSHSSNGCLSVSMQGNTCHMYALERYCTLENIMKVPLATYAEKVCLKEVRDIRQCGYNITNPMVLISPAYPLYYGEEIFCQWYIRFPENKTIKIDILELNLATADTTQCQLDQVNRGNCEDQLRIYSKRPQNAFILDKTKHRGSTLYSSTNELFIELISCDRSSNVVTTNYSRFALNISETDLVGCGFVSKSSRHTCTSPRGIIASPYNSAKYHLKSEVNWRIVGKKGQYIQLQFSTIDIASDKNCLYSHVAVYNVDLSGKKSIIDKYCTWKQKYGILRSNLNVLELVMTAVPGNVGTGFSAVFEMVNGELDFDQPTAQNPKLACDGGWKTWGGGCYKYFDRNVSVTWNEAEKECVKHGGHLLSVNNKDEMTFIHHLLISDLKVNSSVIIGLYKANANGGFYDYRWADGRIPSYFDWHSDSSSSQPDGSSSEKCTVIEPNSVWSTRSWHDYMCAYNGYNRFICEKPSRNNTGIDIGSLDTPQHLENNTWVFVCDDGSVILQIYWCDGVIDCWDGSDENKDCHQSADNRHFVCNSGQHVHLSVYCDFTKDCGDGSDESSCNFRICDDSEWTCKNKQCIKKYERCDFKQDCVDNSDEEKCDVCVEEGFQCFDQKCIPSSRVCDGFIDCTGKFHEDEGDTCINKVQFSCEAWYRLGKRQDGMYLVNYGEKGYFPVECLFPQDSTSNEVTVIVHHDLDEQRPSEISAYYTPKYGATTKQTDTLINSIDCQQNVSLHCSGYGEAWVEIHDKKYNLICIIGVSCTIVDGRSKCGSGPGEVVARLSQGEQRWVTDTVSISKRSMPVKTVSDQSASIRRAVTIGPIICKEAIKNVTSDRLLCKNDVNIDKKHICVLNLDDNGEVEGCRDMTHLEKCESFLCPENYVKCPNSFCIPRYMFCDGIQQCPDGSDEMHCDKPTCTGLYKCRNSTICLPLSEICDGIGRCPHRDDEALCNITQPEGCEVEGLLATCASSLDLRSLSSKLRKLKISHTFVNQSEVDFNKFEYLGKLILSGTKTESISQSTFEDLSNLFYLDVSNNSISGIENHTFAGLQNLLELNISQNRIEDVDPGAFSNLPKLQTLDLRRNHISNISKATFSGLSSLKYLYTDEYRFCCVKPDSVAKENCFPPEDEFSSCTDLMRNDVLRICLWTIGSFALVGNALCIICRLIFDHESLRKAHGLFVLNLCISDFLMGIYLFIIATADEIHRGHYIEKEKDWRNSIWCQTAGFLVTLSSEVSTTMLCIITLDRVLAIKFPFSQFKFNVPGALISLLCIWICNILISAIPLLPIDYFEGKFYSRSGVCLALPLTRDRPPGWMYSVFVFLVYNFAAFLVIVFGQIAIYMEIRKVSSANIRRSGGQEQNVARNLFIIVFTDFICWFPVAIMGMFALNGYSIPGEIYAWTAVFIVPINSALNPLLYTATALLRKQRRQRESVSRKQYSTETKLSQISTEFKNA